MVGPCSQVSGSLESLGVGGSMKHLNVCVYSPSLFSHHTFVRMSSFDWFRRTSFYHRFDLSGKWSSSGCSHPHHILWGSPHHEFHAISQELPVGLVASLRRFLASLRWSPPAGVQRAERRVKSSVPGRPALATW